MPSELDAVIARVRAELDAATPDMPAIGVFVEDAAALLAALDEAREDVRRVTEADVDALAIAACCRYNGMSGNPGNIEVIGNLLKSQESTMMRWKAAVQFIVNCLSPMPSLPLDAARAVPPTREGA